MGQQVSRGECMDEGVIGSDAGEREKKLYVAVKIILKPLMPERDKEEN